MAPARPKEHREGQGCEYSLEEVFTCSFHLYLNLRVCFVQQSDVCLCEYALA